MFLKSRQAACKCPFPGLYFVTDRDVPLPCTPDPIHTEVCFQLRQLSSYRANASASFLLGLCLENNFDSDQPNNQDQIREEPLRRIRKICSRSKTGVLRETRATLICVVLPPLIQAAQLGDVPFRSTMENSVEGWARCPAGLSAGSSGGLCGTGTKSSTPLHRHPAARVGTISTAHHPGQSESSPRNPTTCHTSTPL